MNKNLNNKQYVNSISKRFLKGDRINAIADLINYLINNSNNNLARYNLGVMYQETRLFTKAIDEYSTVITNDKKHLIENVTFQNACPVLKECKEFAKKYILLLKIIISCFYYRFLILKF